MTKTSQAKAGFGWVSIVVLEVSWLDEYGNTLSVPGLPEFVVPSDRIVLSGWARSLSHLKLVLVSCIMQSCKKFQSYLWHLFVSASMPQCFPDE